MQQHPCLRSAFVRVLDLRRQRRFQEHVDVAVEHGPGVRGLDLGAQVLDHLIGLQDVRPDLPAPADFGFRILGRLGGVLALLQFHLVQARTQHRHRLGAVLVLRTVVLALHDDTGRLVRDADRAFRLVDVLAAGAGRAVGVDAQVLVVDFDVYVVVDDRRDPGRGKTGVAARRRIVGRDTHQPVHAAFRLQPTVGVEAGDFQRRRLDAGFFAGAFFEPFDLIAVMVGPAGIHAQKHFSPVLRLCAAGTGLDLQEAVVLVGFARQQRFQLRLLGTAEQFAHRRLGLGHDVGVAFGFGQFKQIGGIAQIAVQTVDFLDAGFDLGALAHQRLRLGGIVPDVRAFGEGVQFFETELCLIVVKDASSAVLRTARSRRPCSEIRRACGRVPLIRSCCFYRYRSRSQAHSVRLSCTPSATGRGS